jgi:hypothetical protein
MFQEPFETFYCLLDLTKKKCKRQKLLVVLGEKPKNQKESGEMEAENWILEVVQAWAPDLCSGGGDKGKVEVVTCCGAWQPP